MALAASDVFASYTLAAATACRMFSRVTPLAAYYTLPLYADYCCLIFCLIYMLSRAYRYADTRLFCYITPFDEPRQRFHAAYG